MSPLDASIPLAAQTYELQTPLEVQTQKLKGQDILLQHQERVRQLQNKAKIAQILQQTNGDFEAALPQISQIDPELGLTVQSKLAETKATALKYQALKLQHARDEADFLGQLAGGVKSPDDWSHMLYTAKTAGIDTSQLPPQYSPDAITALTEGAKTAKQRADEALKKVDDARQAAQADEAARHNQATEQRQHEATMAQIDNIKADNERQAARDRETARHNRAVEAHQAAEDSGVTLSPQGLDIAAENYAKTGQLPPMGMGKQGASVRSKIINRAAELHPDLDLASAKAGFQANEGSLKQLQKSRDAISAFESTALKNIDTFLETAGKVVDTGSPLANRVARTLAGNVLGSKDQAAYNAARQVALNEIAKIVSNPNLAGTLSDSARHEVEAFNPDSATLKQSVAVMRILKRDMANRANAYDTQIAEIKSRIKGGTAETGAVEEWVRDPKTGKLVKKGAQ